MVRQPKSGNKLLTTKLLLTFIIFVINSLIGCCSLLLAQEEVKACLFQKTVDLLYQGKAEQADLLSPTWYAKASEGYELALRDYDRGKNIQKKLVEINQFLESATAAAKLARRIFPHLIAVREDAIQANAVEYAQELYGEAEALFQETARTSFQPQAMAKLCQSPLMKTSWDGHKIDVLMWF